MLIGIYPEEQQTSHIFIKDLVIEIEVRHPPKLGPFPRTVGRSKSYLLEYLHFKEMPPTSLRQEFCVVEDLQLKGERKDLYLQAF